MPYLKLSHAPVLKRQFLHQRLQRMYATFREFAGNMLQHDSRYTFLFFSLFGWKQPDNREMGVLLRLIQSIIAWDLIENTYRGEISNHTAKSPDNSVLRHHADSLRYGENLQREANCCAKQDRPSGKAACPSVSKA